MDTKDIVSDDGEELWTPQQTADFLKMSPQTLANWRSSPETDATRRLQYCYVGNKPRYRKSDVLAFLKANAASCTGQRFAKQRLTKTKPVKLDNVRADTQIQIGHDQPTIKPLREGQLAYFDLLQQVAKYTMEEQRPAVRYYLRQKLGL
jgi:hypothetical protein